MATIVTVAGKGSPLTATEMDANFSNLNTDKLEDATSDGSQYIRQNGSWATFTVDALVETSSTKPSNPIDGHAWFSESNGVTYVYDSASGDWIAVGSSNTSGISSLAAASDISVSSVANGDVLIYDSNALAFKNAQKYLPAPYDESPATVYKTQYSGTTSNAAITYREITITSGWSPTTNGVFTVDAGIWLVEATMVLLDTSGVANGHIGYFKKNNAGTTSTVATIRASASDEAVSTINILESVASTTTASFYFVLGVAYGESADFDASINFIKVGDV